MHEPGQCYKTNIWTNWQQETPDGIHWEGHNVTFVVFLPKMHNQSLSDRKHQQTKIEGRLKNINPYSSKNQGQERQKKG